MHARLLAIAASTLAVTAWVAPKPPVHHAPSVVYVAHMNGTSETPANTTTGTGTATLTLSGNRLRYSVTVHGLSGPATAAHIHVGGVGVSGPPVYVFKIKHIAAGRLAQGYIDLTKDASKGVSGDSLKTLLANGNANVSIGTAAHPAGEIRGQVELKK